MLLSVIRGNDEVISRGEAERNLAISQCNYIQNCTKNHVITIFNKILIDISG